MNSQHGMTSAYLDSSLSDAKSSPIEKDQLFDGEWSILILSNNGNCAPIGYQRDFILTVGDQTTLTYTPTVTFVDTTTPVTCTL